MEIGTIFLAALMLVALSSCFVPNFWDNHITHIWMDISDWVDRRL